MQGTYKQRFEFLGEGAVPLASDESASHFVRTVTGAAPPTATFKSGITDAVGVLELALTNDSQVQNISAHNGDVLSYPLSRLLRARFRCKLATALGSTAATTQVAFGFASARNDDIDTLANALLFRVLGDASGAVIVESDDGTNNNDDISTGGQTLKTDWKEFVIDFTQGLKDVRFYMGADKMGVGVGLDRVASGTTFDVSNVTAPLQLYFQLQKAANTDVGTFQCDYVELDYRQF